MQLAQLYSPSLRKLIFRAVLYSFLGKDSDKRERYEGNFDECDAVVN